MSSKAMRQTRAQSIAESCVSTAIGYAIAILAQLAIFPAFGIHLPLSDNLLIAAFFTVVSIIRGYAVRRMFNAWQGRSS